MPYQNSITYAVQQNFNNIMKQVISSGNESLDDVACDEMYDFLCDLSMCNTFDFLLRRHIQTHFPNLFTGFTLGIDYADLTQNNNVAWPESLLEQLGTKLYSLIRKEQGIEIQKQLWINYLSDNQTMHRDIVFKLAFVLHMNEMETAAMLLSTGYRGYIMRRPQDFIYYYCSKRASITADGYTWKEVEKLIQEYKNRQSQPLFHPRDAASTALYNKQANWTKQVRSSNISEWCQLPKKEAEESLLLYIHNNYQEFIFSDKSDTTPSGYSITTYNIFLAFSRYLVILYPTYQHLFRSNKEKKDQIENRLVQIDQLGFPNFKQLLTAMKQENFVEVGYRRKMGTQNFHLEKHILQYLKKYGTHIHNVLLTPEHNPNTEPIERSDILLMSYFFLSAYWNIVDQMDTEKQNKLEALAQTDSILGDCMESIMEQMSEAIENEVEFDELQIYFRSVINRLLQQFEFAPFYIPNLIDRFIMLLLFITTQYSEDGVEDLFTFILDKQS